MRCLDRRVALGRFDSIGRGGRIVGFISILVFAMLCVAPARAQIVTVDPAGMVRSEGLGRAFETFSVFGGTPGIAAAQYLSDFNITNYQLPISHTFAPIGSGVFQGVAPYAELTVGYLTADATAPIDTNPGGGGVARLRVDSWSALSGFGLDIPIPQLPGLHLRPIVLAGYSRVGVSTDFSGSEGAFLKGLLRGVLDRASINTALVGGALDLRYERTLGGDLRLAANLRYNELASIVTAASNADFNRTGSFGVASGGVTLTGPTDWSIAGRPLRWLGYTRGTWLPDSDPSTLGFNAYVELGGGMQIISPGVIPTVEGATVRASAIVGPGVRGWLASVALDF
jgi:hypothetical protein